MDFSTPKVMGVINVTPDSFFEGSRKVDSDDILRTSEKMLREGATFLDIGGYSTRPGSIEVDETEELDRVCKAIELVSTNFPDAILSIDSFRSKVAKEACLTGAAIINDISGGHIDSAMLKTVAELQVPYIAMHMRGTPHTMMEDCSYENLTLEVTKYFSAVLKKANELRINDVLIDPGFGFSKTLEQNYELLSRLEHFKFLNAPILVGLSRKSMIYKLLNITPNEALNGTTSLNTLALFKGASILRVHDIREACEVVKIVNQLK